jgi:hypothetical protein
MFLYFLYFHPLFISYNILVTEKYSSKQQWYTDVVKLFLLERFKCPPLALKHNLQYWTTEVQYGNMIMEHSVVTA